MFEHDYMSDLAHCNDFHIHYTKNAGQQNSEIGESWLMALRQCRSILNVSKQPTSDNMNLLRGYCFFFCESPE